MTLYETVHGTSMYAHLLDELLHRPTYACSPRGLATQELADATIMLRSDGDDGGVWGRTQEAYLFAETAWYLSRNREVANIMPYASLWGRVQNPDGTANSNYGEALWGERRSGGSEFKWALQKLVDDADTRQAVAVIHEPVHHWVGNKDMPCTLTVSWRLRGPTLEQRVHMRSCDAWFGLPYDLPWWRWVQRRMAWSLSARGVNVRPGDLLLTMDSLHLYANKAKTAEAWLANYAVPSPSWVHPVPTGGDLGELSTVCWQLAAAAKRRDAYSGGSK